MRRGEPVPIPAMASVEPSASGSAHSGAHHGREKRKGAAHGQGRRRSSGTRDGSQTQEKQSGKKGTKPVCHRYRSKHMKLKVGSGSQNLKVKD